MIHIVVALDEPYWNKAQSLFRSIHHHTSMTGDISVKVLTIGFQFEKKGTDFRHNRWEFQHCNLRDLKSYRTDFPKNRPFYICAEGGEFLDYFSFKDDDVIIHIDADMLMQRPFSEVELKTLKNLRYGEVGASYHSNPAIAQREEFSRLKSPNTEDQAKAIYPNHWDKSTFCAGLVACTVKTYKDVIYNNYLSGMDNMVKVFTHHAAGQWVMNYVVYEYGNFYNLGRSFHNANWFLGTEKKYEDGKLMYKDDIVLFNHTKFNLMIDATDEAEGVDWNYM